MRVVDTGHIVTDPEVLSGEPHIAGHRIGVSDVAVWAVYQGKTPDEIAATYQLTLGEVHAALAYYYDHKAQIDAEIADYERRLTDMAARYPHGWGPTGGTSLSEE